VSGGSPPELCFSACRTITTVVASAVLNIHTTPAMTTKPQNAPITVSQMGVKSGWRLRLTWSGNMLG
jgi:hypothetical protein